MKAKNRQKVLLGRTVQGFTLIELLVTISIISILAAILFPVFARARENARRSSCMSNMKQLALATLMYVQDYDGKLMGYYNYGGPGNRFVLLEPYIKNTQMFRCPSAPATTIATTSQWYPTYGYSADYTGRNRKAVVMGGHRSDTVTYPTCRLDSLPMPSRTCLLGETRYTYSTSNNYENNGYAGSMFNASSTNADGEAYFLLYNRHFEGSNYAFVDGHVKWIKEEAARQSVAKDDADGGITSEADAAGLQIVFGWNESAM